MRATKLIYNLVGRNNFWFWFTGLKTKQTYFGLTRNSPLNSIVQLLFCILNNLKMWNFNNQLNFYNKISLKKKKKTQQNKINLFIIYIPNACFCLINGICGGVWCNLYVSTIFSFGQYSVEKEKQLHLNF